MNQIALKEAIKIKGNLFGVDGKSFIANWYTSANSSNGGRGGGGLYIISKNVVISRSIKLTGGNGIWRIMSACNSTYQSASAGGGAGSCIMSTNNMINNSGSFQANGGLAGLTTCTELVEVSRKKESKIELFLK